MMGPAEFLFRHRDFEVHWFGYAERWIVNRECSHALREFFKKSAAVDFARRRARREGVALKVYDRQGILQSREEFA